MSTTKFCFIQARIANDADTLLKPSCDVVPFGYVVFGEADGLFGFHAWLIEGKHYGLGPWKDITGLKRWMMSARALLNRLKIANPKSEDDFRLFAAKEANE